MATGKQGGGGGSQRAGVCGLSLPGLWGPGLSPKEDLGSWPVATLSLSFPMKGSGCANVWGRPAGLGAEAAAWWGDFY